MKTIRIFMAVTTLVLVAAVSSVKAQTLTTLYNFCGVTNSESICTDGNDPANLVHGTDGNFYGATSNGGTNDDGTIFKITPEGTLTTLHQFSGNLGPFDGTSPSLILESGGLFYGTTLAGGTNRHGAIFTISPAGTFTLLHQFSGTNGVADGTDPGILLPSGSSFIGSTIGGGTNNAGTIFTITPAGTLTTIRQFSGTNNAVDGAFPELTFADGANFIGTFFNGIPGETLTTGTVFQITAGGAFTTIHAFGGAQGTEPIVTAKSGANFIGTVIDGGSNGVGSAFEMTSAGTVTTFYQFSGTNGVMDGSSPGLEPITDSAGAFYGVTSDGGTNGQGLIFTLSTSGTLTHVYEFCSVGACLDGSSPNGFVQSSGDLFGTTDGGGDGANGGGGTVFKLVPAGGIGGGGGSCTFTLSASSASPSAAGGSATVGVTAGSGCTWTAASNDGFITVTSGSSGSGNGTVHYTVAANSTTNPVVGTMTIAGDTFTVTQAGAGAPEACTFTVSPTTITLTDKGGKKSVSVKTKGTDCTWTAVSNDSFIMITSGGAGTNSGKVEFIVQANTNTTALSGTMTIAGETVTVNQAIGGCTFKLSPKSAKFKDTGGLKTVKVTPNLTNCTWTAFSNSGFITITGGTNGVGKGVVSYTISTNATTNTLSGTMTIAGQTYTVTQSGEKPPKD